MEPLHTLECFVFLPVTQARSSAAANKQQWGCCARAPVPHPLQGTGTEPGPAAGQVQPTGRQLQPRGLCQPRSIHKTLCSAEGRGTTSRPSRRKENQLSIHFFVVPASHVPEVCKHRPPPHQADPVAELLKGFKHQLPREVPLIFVYKGSKQKG